MSTQEVVNSEKFKKLVTKRWAVSFSLLIILFIMYYGYIMTIALQKDFIASKVIAGGSTTVGIVLGLGVILGAWLLTIVYVIWANKKYDPAVAEIKKEIQ